LSAKVVCFAFASDAVLIYPLYAVMFAEQGLSTGQISLLLVVWSAVAFMLEVPTGALGDRFSRRHVLAVAQLFRAAAFLLWWLVPTFTGYAAGFVLWAIESAMTSGTFEALVYDELRARGEEAQYARLLGRAESASLAGVVLGGLLSAPLVTLGFAPVLWASALASVVTAGVALSFPTASAAMRTTERRYLTHLREGVGVAMRDRTVRRILLFSAVMLGLGAIDEFFPLLLRDAGIANPAISIWIAASCLGAGLASLGAYRVMRTSGRHVAGLAVGIALTLIAAAVFGGIAVPLALIGYEAVSVVQRVVLGAQLQAAISSDSRATITSVQGLTAELVALACFAVFGHVSSSAGIDTATIAIAAAFVLAAVLYRATGWRRVRPLRHLVARREDGASSSRRLGPRWRIRGR
jgi:predicted MFS family arabinose efflux permease